MTANTPAHAATPWYRQFWPWFLIALPGAVVIAAFVTFYIANRHADDLVVDEYYKEGLAINRRLAKQQRARDLGIDATLTIGPQSLRLYTTGPVADPVLSLSLAHPMEADRDFQLSLARHPDGGYTAPLSAAIAPHWHWSLENRGDVTWRVEGSLSAQDFSAIDSDN